ncbi:DUF7529 family protein [Halorarius halobius]|uniref:DUF7529 family protein n=1 Tax=Halorarius halobius TaxID=2962671 RepID=UPI0020CC6AC1|nr:hypothetical protein [Halorarius halobius]
MDDDEQSDEAASAPAFAPGGAAAAIREHWETFIGDMEATAEEFQAAGWEVLELHPGDVTALSGEQWGFDVLVPDDEFEELERWVADGSFDDHDVYRAAPDLVFVLVVLKDADAERAICCPIYYERDAMEGLRELAAREGHIYTHVRRLSEEYVHFTHEEPDLFFPDED